MKATINPYAFMGETELAQERARHSLKCPPCTAGYPCELARAMAAAAARHRFKAKRAAKRAQRSLF